VTLRISLGSALVALFVAVCLVACQQTLVLDDPSADASLTGTGGKGGGSGGGGGGGPSDASSDARCFGNQAQQVSFTSDTPQVLIALDRSAMMTGSPFGSQDTEFSAATTDLSAAVSRYAPSNGQHNARRTITFAYLDFPGSSNDCLLQPGSGCCPTDVAPTNGYLAFESAISCDAPNVCVQSNNRPTAAALTKAHDYYNYFNGGTSQPGQRYVLLVTDGAPSGCNTASPPGDCSDALGEINALNDLNVTTVIVEVGNQTSTPCLQELANAGAAQPFYNGPLYSAATTPNDLVNVLGAVAQGIAADACHLTLSMGPSSSDQLSVWYDGSNVSQGSNGWYYDASALRLTLHGTTCQNFIQNGQSGLQIFDGCSPSHLP
jgi:hypothetical protein